MQLKLVDGALEVVKMPDYEQYNHEVSTRVASFYPEIRKLTEPERAKVTDLLVARVAPRLIASTVNAARKSSGQKGLAVTKDIFNHATAVKQLARGGRPEEEILRQFIIQQQERDPGGTFDVLMPKTGSDELSGVYVQTSHMKETFAKNRQVFFG